MYADRGVIQRGRSSNIANVASPLPFPAKFLLAKRFIKDDRRRRRQIQTSHLCEHRNSKAAFALHDARRKPSRLAAEQQNGIGVKGARGVKTPPFRRQREPRRPQMHFSELLEIEMAMDFDMLPVVEPGPFDPRIVERKPKPTDEVERRRCRCTNPRHRTDVVRNFRFEQRNVHR